MYETLNKSREQFLIAAKSLFLTLDLMFHAKRPLTPENTAGKFISFHLTGSGLTGFGKGLSVAGGGIVAIGLDWKKKEVTVRSINNNYSSS